MNGDNLIQIDLSDIRFNLKIPWELGYSSDISIISFDKNQLRRRIPSWKYNPPHENKTQVSTVDVSNGENPFDRSKKYIPEYFHLGENIWELKWEISCLYADVF